MELAPAVDQERRVLHPRERHRLVDEDDLRRAERTRGSASTTAFTTRMMGIRLPNVKKWHGALRGLRFAGVSPYNAR